MLNIRSAEAVRLARRLADATGQSITAAVTNALREELRRVEGRTITPSLAADLMEISRRCASYPDLDNRTEDEIVGYNALGAW